jgi:hypothetical protein
MEKFRRQEAQAQRSSPGYRRNHLRNPAVA